MTPRERALKVAREIGTESGLDVQRIERAITAAVAKETERCATVARDKAQFLTQHSKIADQIAAAIRRQEQTDEG